MGYSRYSNRRPTNTPRQGWTALLIFIAAGVAANLGMVASPVGLPEWVWVVLNVFLVTIALALFTPR